MVRRTAAIVGAVGLTALLLGGSATRPRTSQSAGAESLATARPSSAASAATYGGSAPTRPDTDSRRDPLCQASHLSVSIGRNGPAAGTVGLFLIFRNVSTSACEVSGWPKIIGIGSTEVPTPAVDERQPFGRPTVAGNSTILLSDSITATAVLTGQDNPGPTGRCAAPFTRLRVSAPDAAPIADLSAFVPGLAANMPNCAGLFISPFVPTQPSDLGR